MCVYQPFSGLWREWCSHWLGTIDLPWSPSLCLFYCRVQDLEEQVTGMKQQKEAEKDKYEVQLTTARSDFQEMRDMLTADNMALQGRLKSLEDYRLHKQEMEGKLAEKESKIASQDKEYGDRLNELEKKNLLDRDRSVQQGDNKEGL